MMPKFIHLRVRAKIMKFLLTLLCIIAYVIGGAALEEITQAPPIFAAYGAIMMMIYVVLQDTDLVI